MLEGDVSEWRLMIETNLLGLLHVTRAALPFMSQAPYADLVNVSSLSGRRVAHSQAAVYTATKAAVHSLSDAMRAELAEHSIRTTVIAPGAVMTSLSEGISLPHLREEIHGLHESVGLDPSDVAKVIVGVIAAAPGVMITELAVQSLGHAARGVH
jgi:NADP-dependent 3-hydroxy acid dehydrogenase YdfG